MSLSVSLSVASTEQATPSNITRRSSYGGYTRRHNAACNNTEHTGSASGTTHLLCMCLLAAVWVIVRTNCCTACDKKHIDRSAKIIPVKQCLQPRTVDCPKHCIQCLLGTVGLQCNHQWPITVVLLRQPTAVWMIKTKTTPHQAAENRQTAAYSALELSV